MTREETLDPRDWNELRVLGHRMVDDMLAYLEQVRDRPVWQSVPEEVKASLAGPPPLEPTDVGAVYEQFRRDILPYPTGNIHPRFWGWVMGTGTPVAMLADMLASGMNPHLAGYDQSASLVERQVVSWMAELLGFPADASGLLVSGGSMANLVGLTVARNTKAGFDVREAGLQTPGLPRLVFYGSSETHSWARKAAELLGLGNSAFRRVPVTADYRIDMGALRSAIAADRKAGARPFCLIGNAGTVNTGATDDLRTLARIARDEDLWFHVDGAFGAFAALAPSLREIVAGMDEADSLAVDLHKWGYLPFEVGLRAGARRSGPPRRVRHPVELPRGDASRHRRRRAALRRAWRAALTRVPGAQGVDVAQDAWRSRAGPAGGAERPAGAPPPRPGRGPPPARAAGAGAAQCRVLPVRRARAGPRRARWREPGDPHPAPGAGHRGAVEHGAGRAVRAARGDHQPPEQARRLRSAGERGGGDRGGAHRGTLWENRPTCGSRRWPCTPDANRIPPRARSAHPSISPRRSPAGRITRCPAASSTPGRTTPPPRARGRARPAGGRRGRARVLERNGRQRGGLPVARARAITSSRPTDAYYGTAKFLREVLAPWGLTSSFVDMTDAKAVERASLRGPDSSGSRHRRIRRSRSPTSRASPRSRTRPARAARATTPGPRRSCSARSISAPTSSCTPPPSIWAGTPT